MKYRYSVLLAFGVCNAVLYAGLQPLWEGFDESFHYGYVQELSRHHRFPVLGRSDLSEEVWQSMALVPVGGRVKANVREGIPYDEYWRLTKDRRRDLRRQLERIDPRLGATPSRSANYEAQQAPLAYLVLAPLDAAGSTMPLPSRVLVLRLWCAVFSAIFTALAALRLARRLEVPEVFRLAAIFLIFSSQMFYATTAHVANDWLAAPLFTLLLSQCAIVHLGPARPRLLLLGLVLSAALLTKAYFLALAPLACGVVLLGVVRRRIPWRHALEFLALPLALAGPWYLRNLLRYRDLSGMQETVGGAPLASVASAAFHLPWLRALWIAGHAGLWTGNSSLVSFHSATISTMLLLLLAAAGLYLGNVILRRPTAAEAVVILGLLSYAAALAYDAALNFWYTHGAGVVPSSSYVQLLSPPLLVLLLLGLSRAGWAGMLLHVAMLWLWAYSIAATYLAKLIPLYAGLTPDRARLSELPGWYARLAAGGGGLSTTALMSAGVVLALTALAAGGAAGLAAWLSFRGVRSAL